MHTARRRAGVGKTISETLPLPRFQRHAPARVRPIAVATDATIHERG